MLTVRLITADGTQYLMPTLLEWAVCRTAAVPADELQVTAVYDGALQEVLPEVCRFADYQDDVLVLMGLVDEYRVSCDERGLLLHVEGRGMAGRLLDNEAEAVTYQRATTREILRVHAEAWGISCGKAQELTCPDYRVVSGSSQWKALSDFTQRAGGFAPWFTPEGTLMVSPLAGSGQRRAIGGDSPVLSCVRQERRYGVISQVLIRDRSQQAVYTAEDRVFQRRGGMRRQVLYLPANSSADTLRYTGEYQLQQSRKGSKQLEIRLAGAFSAQPGDIVEVAYDPLQIYGSYDVAETLAEGSAAGETTTLRLEERYDVDR